MTRNLEIKLHQLEQANKEFGNQVKFLIESMRGFENLRLEIIAFRKILDYILERDQVLMCTAMEKTAIIDYQSQVINKLLEKLYDK